MNIGIEIGGTKLQVVAGNGRIERRLRFPVDKSRGAAGILAQLDAALAELGGPATAVGVGFGGPVDGATGRIATSHQIDGWTGFGLGDWLRQRTRSPRVRVENDANVAALGEALHGAGRGFRHVFYVTLGSGVGGGMVIDGQIYRGAMPGEAEIGHIRLDRQGQTLESVCAGWAVDAPIRRVLPQLPPGSILKQRVGAHTTGEARFLREAWDGQDPAALRLLDRLCDDLAFGLSHAVHLFHPDVVVLGGGLSLVGEPLRAGVAARLPAYVMAAFQPPPAVRLAQLGEDVVPMGALSL